jgi:two-component system, chemotaxis family, sensor kinase CheA
VSVDNERLQKQFRELVTVRLTKVTRALMSLESGADREQGRLIQRELHGLKGESGMMGYAKVAALAHAMEEVLRAVEPRHFELDSGSADALLAACDGISALVEPTSNADVDVDALLAWLRKGQMPVAESSGELTPLPREGSVGLTPAATSAVRSPNPKKRDSKWVNKLDDTIRIGQPTLEKLTANVVSLQQLKRRRHELDHFIEGFAAGLTEIERAGRTIWPTTSVVPAKLGHLKELAAQYARESVSVDSDEERELEALTSEIQSIRMLPLGVLFESYPRMVRDLAADLSKRVALRVEGEELQVDRTVLEALRDPLLHMVRNAVDHGIESPDLRVVFGKPAVGSLKLEGRREGDRLVLRVSDDGAGIDPKVLKDVAVKRGFYSENDALSVDDKAALELIFLPGFSSREEVTGVSGRGVGLDVVRTQLQALGGEISVLSTLGAGTTLELRVPISLTVSPVLFVESGGECFGVAAANVIEVLPLDQLERADAPGRVMVHWRDQLLPLIAAPVVLGLGRQSATPASTVVIVQSKSQQVALLVDRLLEQRDQAILPLNGLLSRFAHLTGATEMPNGAVSLVIAATELVEMAYGRAALVHSSLEAKTAVHRSRVMVVDDSPLTRDLLASLLSTLGYDVISVESGNKALAALKAQPIELVVTDLEMPGMDGFALTRAIKEDQALRGIPVLMVSTRASEQDRIRGMNAGADGYVTKSDSVRRDLTEAMRRLLPLSGTDRSRSSGIRNRP